MNKISVLATFGFINEGQREIDSVKSTFSVLNSFIQDADQSGNNFVKTLNNLNNIDLSAITRSGDGRVGFGPNLIFRISPDNEQLLERIESLDGETIDIQTNLNPAPDSGAPLLLRAATEGLLFGSVGAVAGLAAGHNQHSPI